MMTLRGCFFMMLGAAFCLPSVTQAEPDRDIRLVLQLTIDGLRYDLMTRSADHYGDDGLGLLLKQGRVFENAHYGHANTETIVGHATLATGAHPVVHGMTGNVWFDRAAGELAYNIEDPAAPLLPVRENANEGDQLDPAQLLARSDGRSPRSLLAETFSDQLMKATGGEAKVFGVSGKDRSAVAMAGHKGKAFWYSTDSGDFITSRYYYENYPAWAQEWNAQRLANDYAGSNWALLGNPESYQLLSRDDRPYEVDLRGFGRVFPHRYASAGSPLLYTHVLVSPAGDALTADFAMALVEAEAVGMDDMPDYLSVSFSSVDAVNHFFGPGSLENEDVVRQLDDTLDRFLAFIDEKVGLEHTLVVLSADHGMADMPEAMSERGVPAGRLYTEIVEEEAGDYLESEFGDRTLLRFFYRPYLYVDDEKIAAAGLDKNVVLDGLATYLETVPGVHSAVSPGRLSQLTDAAMAQRISNNHHPERAGDLYLVQKPYWFNYERGAIAAMHGSPWDYDTHVPIIFLGPGIKSGLSSASVQPADVAPTLSALLGISAPASSQGAVMEFVAPKKEDCFRPTAPVPGESG